MAVITGDADNNVLSGTADDDRIRGLRGDDWLSGLAGDDRICGGAGNDTIYGGTGDDIIVGGAGRDIMSGGAGDDTFRFDDRDTGDFSAGPLSDVICDFSAGDILDLTDVDLLFWGYGSQPERGAFSTWQAGGSTYVTWNTFGTYHDVELRGYTGDVNSQIRWYEDDFSANVNTTGRIEAGESLTATIEQQEDQDWFQVTLSAGFVYTFDLRGEASGAGTLADPHLTLYDADGNWLTEDYDGSGTPDARLSFFAGTTGTYYIAADGTGYTSGTYQLEVTESATGEIAEGETKAGDISAPNEQDWFQVTLSAGYVYTFDLRGEASGAGTLGDPHLALYDADGNWLTEDYDGSGTLDARLSFAASTTNTYYIAADGTGYTSGTYQLEVTAFADDYAGDASTTGEIAAGETKAGDISASNDQDWFRISLTQGELYTFDLRGESSGGGTLYDPHLVLYDADGNWLTEDYDGSGTLDARLSFSASTSGTYYIAADGSGYSSGTYQLKVTALTDDYAGDVSTTGKIAAGETRVGQIERPNDEDWFRIEFTKDQTYTIDLRGESLSDPYLNLRDSDGNSIVANDDWDGLDSRIVYTAEESGTYFLGARAFSDLAGTYALSVAAGELLNM